MAYVGFKALSSQLAAKGAKDPDALAAWIGKKKYGKKKFASLVAAGRNMDMTSGNRGGVETRAVSFELDESESDGRTLVGYAAVFDHATTVRDALGEFDEVLKRGTFKRTIEGRWPVVMFNHGNHPLIGDIPLGPLRSIAEDSKGLYVKAPISDNWLMEPVRDAIRDGAVTGMSFRFSVPKSGETWETRDGQPDLRTITDADVFELGPVVFPAYEPTTASIRSRLDRLPVVGTAPELRPSASRNPSGTPRTPSAAALARHRGLLLEGVLDG